MLLHSYIYRRNQFLWYIINGSWISVVLSNVWYVNWKALCNSLPKHIAWSRDLRSYMWILTRGKQEIYFAHRRQITGLLMVVCNESLQIKIGFIDWLNIVWYQSKMFKAHKDIIDKFTRLFLTKLGLEWREFKFGHMKDPPFSNGRS